MLHWAPFPWGCQLGSSNHDTVGMSHSLPTAGRHFPTVLPPTSLCAPQLSLSLSRRKDDILVGAPLYMERRSDRKLYEVGRVYLYLQLGRPYSNPWQKLTGTDVYGRFGTAIAPLGDLDQDGYMDVAVGAPFAGKGGSGRVFIYSGHSEGLQTPASQVLDSPFSGRASFGFSVRGATDIDANGYPDMLVGAFGAGKVAVYRAQPVVMAETQLSMPDMLNPEEKTSNWGAVCFWVCASSVQPLSTGNCDYPMLPLAPELNANLQLDRMKQKSGKRIFLLKPQESTLTLKLSKEGPPFCHSFSAYLRDEADFKDKLSPIVVSINLTLAIPLDTEDLGLVLYGDTLVQKQTRIVLDCGEDNVCIPDLRLSAYTHLDYLLIGAENMVHIKVDAANEGEGAFEAELQVQLPPSAHYQRAISNIQGMEKLICNPKKKNETHVVICELGNPMKTGTKVWGISAACQTVPISFSCCLCLRQAAKALNPQCSTQQAANSIPCPPYMTGLLPPALHLFLSSPKLHNKGPGTVSGVALQVDFLSQFQSDFFLYLAGHSTEGKINCSDSRDINPLGVRVEMCVRRPLLLGQGKGGETTVP
uniref:Integrin subunit alpha 2b n=1 Tax=Crocodylus porosus TaxID=8502 RepID=A0A7M4DW69_CROPO